LSAAAALGDPTAESCLAKADTPRASPSPNDKQGSESKMACVSQSTLQLDEKFSLKAGDRLVPWVAAVCNDGYALGTAPVGSFSPNDFSLFDMVGNIWEWVGDCFATNYKNAPMDGRAFDVESCSLRVLRGGAWAMNTDGWRSADRDRDDPHTAYAVVGFRVARSLE
jgi:formylglycine-generating enzyme required for sulfatase activity